TVKRRAGDNAGPSSLRADVLVPSACDLPCCFCRRTRLPRRNRHGQRQSPPLFSCSSAAGRGQSLIKRTGRRASMKRFRRPFLIALVVLLILAAGGLVGAHLYLSSSAAAHQVAHSLESTLGLPVEVGRASVGLLGESTVSSLRIAEAGGDTSKPFLTVREVR